MKSNIWIELTRNLAVRDVEYRYKHSALGLYWALINPLLTATIFGFVFAVIFHANSKPLPYPIFLLTGLTFWNFFANSVMSAMTSITGNGALLAKIYFPRIVLPTASVIARSIDFMFSMVILLLFILLYHVPIAWTIIWVPVIFILQIIFTLGISYVVASLNVFFRDMSQLMGLVLMVWVYLSPVMYSLRTQNPMLQDILWLNPMGTYIEMERNLMFDGHLSHPLFLIPAVGAALFSFVIGKIVFNRLEKMFAEVM